MSKFKAGDKVVRVANGKFGTMDIGDTAIVDELYGSRSFILVDCGDFKYDTKSYELVKEADTLGESVTKAKELQGKINVLQKELDQHLSVMKEYGIQFIEGATDVA